MTIYTALSIDETKEVAKAVSLLITPGDTVAFTGSLGAGKTTFIKSLVSFINGSEEDIVTSPTFQYLNVYTGNPTVYHFDVWRLQGIDDFIGMGFDEYFFYRDGICLIEWAERIEEILPKKTIRIRIDGVTETTRTITVWQS